jgi:RNA polymerase sigma-70 factor (ECF subfamily)
MSTDSDRPLVERAANGDRDAFDVLVQSSRPWIFGICLRLVHDSRTAEDLTQDALLQAFRNLAQLRQPDRFRSWLSRIAVNACRMHLRRLLSRPEEASGVEEALAPVETDAPPPFGVDDALTRIDPLSRRVLLLFYSDELSHDEIADALSLSAAAVKSRLHRAREQLRREMLKTMSEEEKAKLGVPEEKPWVLRTVLLVEPDAAIRQPLLEELQAAGHEVVTLPTGEAALEAVKQRRGQMLILDKECVEPNWVEVLTLLRVDAWSRENVPAAVLVDPDVERDLLLAWQAGAEVCLHKPPQVDRLVGYVNHIAQTWGKDLKPLAEHTRQE